MQINISNKDRLIVEEFADARTTKDAAFYKKRRGAFKREDIVCGALAELGAYKYLIDTDTTVSYPDFTIHKKKSFDPDLLELKKEEPLKFHIKGQTLDSEKKYGCSFLFQKTDKLVSEPGNKDILILCVVDLDQNIIYIKRELYANEIVWGLPKIKWLQYNKKALYLDEQF